MDAIRKDINKQNEDFQQKMHSITNALPELREKADVLDKKIAEKEKNNDRIIKDSCATQKENGQIELSIKNIYQTLMSADNKNFVDKSMSAESTITAIGMKLDDICRMLNADKQITVYL